LVKASCFQQEYGVRIDFAAHLLFLYQNGTMDINEKRKIMTDTVKPIVNLLEKRMGNKMEALKAYDGPIKEANDEISRIREIEAVKLRHEIDVLKDLNDIVKAMYPEI
jgi:hypothetical protein